MKRTRELIALIAIAAVAAGAGDAFASGKSRSVARSGEQKMIESASTKLTSIYSQAEMEKGVYVGSEFCIACHRDHGTWRNTKHAQALRRPMGMYSLQSGKGVVADYDKNGVDDFRQGLNFNTISSVFDPYKPNAPVLSYEAANDGYFITINGLKMPVVSTQGGTGEWKQRYLVRVPVSDLADGLTKENYVSPIQYNETTRQYVLYHADAWYSAAKLPLFGPGMGAAAIAAGATKSSYSKACIGCHTTGLKDLAKTDKGEWSYKAYPAVLFAANDPSYFDYDHDGNADLVNIGCEACHGPGSRHVMAGGAAAGIFNPAKATTDKANETCGQCHVRVKSIPAGTHDWPFKDDTKTVYLPGSSEPLTSFFKPAAGNWPDGIHPVQHHQQYHDFLNSSKPGFKFHPVRCTECHEVHGHSANKAMIVNKIVTGGKTVPTRTSDNTLCLSCHATHGEFEAITVDMVVKYSDNLPAIAKVVAAHTRHPYAPERVMGLSRCVDCHMPQVAKTAIDHDIRSHTFVPISPEKTLAYKDQGGMPNACASCHGRKAIVHEEGMNPSIGKWNEQHDQFLATSLLKYFGPGGIWWDTTKTKSLSLESNEKSTPPGMYTLPPSFDPEN